MIMKMLSLRKISPKFKPSIIYSIFNIPPNQVNSNYPIIQNYHICHKIKPNLKPPLIFETKYLSSLALDPSKITLQIENSIDEKNLENAWILYEKYLHIYALPHKSILTKLISSLTQTFELNYLQKAHNIVNLAFDQNKSDFLERETLIYLSYILARNQMPEMALNIIRKLIKIKLFPPISSLSGIVGHMCQNKTGSFLASELIIEIINNNNNNNKLLVLVRPNSFIFTIVLMGCVNFNLTKKAEQIMDLISLIGFKPGSELVNVMAIVYERNGRIDELRKLKRYIEELNRSNNLDLMIFYDCLLSCDLKFGDLNSCVDLVLNMLGKPKMANNKFRESKNENDYYNIINNQPINYISFINDINYSKLENEAKLFLDISLNRLRAQVDLVKIENKMLYPCELLYAKLVRKFLEEDKIAELARFLIRASKLDSIIVNEVINACIYLGFLNHAHDLLDEMRFTKIRVCDSVYNNLLMAYKRNNCEEGFTTLLSDARQAGIQTLISQNDENLIMKPSQKNDNNNNDDNNNNNNNEASLMAKLLEEIKQNPSTDHDANYWNNIIHFFCKKKMIKDAKKAFNKMKNDGHKPNSETYHSLITAYNSIGGKYADVADLWGEIKILKNSNSNFKFDQELLDSLLYCFVRGGFFLRAMEIIEIMEKIDFFIDKYKYRALWLKYHKTLYKGKANKIINEAQLIRREAALNFKKWIGLN